MKLSQEEFDTVGRFMDSFFDACAKDIRQRDGIEEIHCVIGRVKQEGVKHTYNFTTVPEVKPQP